MRLFHSPASKTEKISLMIYSDLEITTILFHSETIVIKSERMLFGKISNYHMPLRHAANWVH